MESLEQFGHLRGVVDRPSSGQMVCGAVAVREDEGPDWLAFYLPTGSLSRVEPRLKGFPFGEDGGPSSIGWRRPIDGWLAGIAGQVYAAVDFRLGLIGFEVSGMTYAKDLDGDPAPPRSVGYVLPDVDGLRYLPATC